MVINEAEWEKTQQLISDMRRELILLEGRLIKLQNEYTKCSVLLDELEPKFYKTSKAFKELLELTLEYRERLGYVDNSEFEYEYFEKAGLL